MDNKNDEYETSDDDDDDDEEDAGQSGSQQAYPAYEQMSTENDAERTIREINESRVDHEGQEELEIEPKAQRESRRRGMSSSSSSDTMIYTGSRLGSIVRKPPPFLKENAPVTAVSEFKF